MRSPAGGSTSAPTTTTSMPSCRTGQLIWKASSQERFGGRGTFYSTPAAAYGRVYIGRPTKVYSFGRRAGASAGRSRRSGYVYGSPAIWNKLVLVGSFSKRSSRSTRDRRHQVAVPGERADLRLRHRPRERRLLLDAEGAYIRAGREAREQVWSFPDGKYSPLVAGPERVYLVGYTRLYGLVPAGLGHSVALRACPRRLPELDAEQEVDFGRYWRAIAARWWFPSSASSSAWSSATSSRSGRTRPPTRRRRSSISASRSPRTAQRPSQLADDARLVSNLVTSSTTRRGSREGRPEGGPAAATTSPRSRCSA